MAIYVTAFGAMGHHLPGMLRAYGDRELFRRFRTRFLLAPLILLGVCAAVFAFYDLDGLILVAVLWATWHAWMQVYGFLRIYDSKTGRVDPARPDLTCMCARLVCFRRSVLADTAGSTAERTSTNAAAPCSLPPRSTPCSGRADWSRPARPRAASLPTPFLSAPRAACKPAQAAVAGDQRRLLVVCDDW